jgi:hypothetical protein
LPICSGKHIRLYSYRKIKNKVLYHFYFNPLLPV